jgi:hypothetical protein
LCSLPLNRPAGLLGNSCMSAAATACINRKRRRALV